MMGLRGSKLHGRLSMMMVVINFQEWLEYGCVEQTTKKLGECSGNLTIDSTLSRCLCTQNYTVNSYLGDNNVTCTNTSNTAVAELFFE